MVGDGSAVDAGTHIAIGVGEIGSAGVVVGSGQTGLVGQAQVRIVGLRNVVIDLVAIRIQTNVRTVIVGGAMRVEDNNSTAFDGVSHVINGNGATGVQGVAVGIANGVGNGGSFVLVLIGEAVINAVVGSDQVNLIAAGPAALGSLGFVVQTGRLGIGRCFHVGILFPHIGVVDAADALICPPGEGIAVALQGAFHIVFRCHNDFGSSIGNLCAACAFLGGSIFHGIDLCKHIVDNGVICIRQDGAFFYRVSMGMQGRQHRAYQTQHKNQGKQTL